MPLNMPRLSLFGTISTLLAGTSYDKTFNPLAHLGGNSPWSPGPNVFGISPDIPQGCTVEQAVYITRHGSRYPDPGAWDEWQALYEKIQSANFTAHGPLAFLKTWKPVLDYPGQQLSQISPGGYDELYTFGTELRTRYPGWYAYNTPFRLWSNDYPRTVDSARLFARGYLGPNATCLGSVFAVNSSSPLSVANSLATSDSCPAYDDDSGAGYVDVWDAIYLPPIVKRLSGFIHGDLKLNSSDLSIFPYLCGFESQITRRLSPFCDPFTPAEILQYEYRQDLRYYYGTGPGSYRNTSVMLPVIQSVVDLLKSGPETAVKEKDGSTGVLGRLVVAFTHDNQINQMVSSLGIFDEQPALAANVLDPHRIYVSSHINPMRGTVAFEKLKCDNESYLRIRLNDAVYPVPSCCSGPGKSCPLSEYASKVLAKKWAAAGSFESFCDLSSGNATAGNVTAAGVPFFTDLRSEAIRRVVV